MTTFKNRLLTAEQEFLVALGEGDSAVSVFDGRWQRLIAELDVAMDSGTLDDETSALAHTISLRIAILADTSADLVENYNAFTAQLVDQMTGLMSELALHDYQV